MIGYELTVFAVMSVTVMLFLLDGVLINKVGRVAYILSIIFIAVCGGVVGFISANGFDSVMGIAAKTVIMICGISVIIYAIALLFLRTVGAYINLTIWILACITLSSGNKLISTATGGRLSAGKIFGVIMNMGNWALMGLGLAAFLVGLGIYWLLIYNKEVNI